MNTCASCRRPNDPDASFCQGCGLPLQSDCRQCGRTNAADSTFCNRCGTRLVSTASASTMAGSSAIRPSPSAPPTDLPTSFKDGRYCVKRFLGQGATKTVFLVSDTVLDRDVAFALIKADGMDDADQQRILREAQMLAKLGDHPNVVQIYDFGQEEEQTFMVMPVMAGGTIDSLVQLAQNGKLDLPVLLRAATGISNGLEFAHFRGIIHRDLKPGNVWLTADGLPRIGDFGIAFSDGQTPLTHSGWLLGTVSYMAPEQATGDKVDERSDLYSLGAMLYELVTGSKPFSGSNPMAIINQHINTAPVPPSWYNPSCPRRLEDLILKLLEKDREDRPTSAGSVINALLTMAALEGVDTAVSKAS